jgi:hypothetical protein
MVAHDDVLTPRPRRRWLRFGAVVLFVGFLIAWLIRAATWPCGMLDQSSGCVSSVKLDIAAAGLDPATAQPGWLSFDLAPGGRTALVGMSGPVETGWRSVLALFDAKTGSLVRVLYSADDPQGSADDLPLWEAALSPDGSLAAGVIRARQDGRPMSTLQVFSVADGRLMTTLFQTDEASDCKTMLDFSADNKRLQCGFGIFDLSDGTQTSIIQGDTILFPMLADFATMYPRAPDGTQIGYAEALSMLELFDSLGETFSYAPDSKGLLQVARAYRENRGQRFYTPAVFRRLSVVGVWDGKTKTLLRSFYVNQRYVMTAWSRDSAFFGFVTGDLRLEVFAR